VDDPCGAKYKHSVSVKTPIIYVTDAASTAANLLDIAFLRHSPNCDLVGVCQTREDIKKCLESQSSPINLVVTSNFDKILDLIEQDRDFFREKVARVFVVGGHLNDYENKIERVPIDPRLKEQHPERFAPTELGASLGRLLTSGEAIIWLPSDICLWRYAAPQLLEESKLDEVRASLAVLESENGNNHSPVLLSSMPAFCLAYQPDITLWLRLFRTIPARLECDENGGIVDFATKPENPNLYVVVAIDGTALTKQITPILRGTLQ
jgi:hypothetical protein